MGLQNWDELEKSFESYKVDPFESTNTEESLEESNESHSENKEECQTNN